MNRNQKIALGCGGLGCLGLIVVVLAGVIFYFMSYRGSSTNRNYNSPSNTNRSNSNANANENSSSVPSSPSSSSMSNDDKHKLFQAAGMTGDTELIARVLKKLGLMRENGSTTPENETFTKEHFAWAMKNLSFIQSVNTPEKARAYVNAHIDD